MDDREKQRARLEARDLVEKVMRGAEAEILAQYPKASGHRRRKLAKALVEKRLEALAQVGNAEAVLHSLGVNSKIMLR